MNVFSFESEFQRINWFVRLFAISPLEKSTLRTRLQCVFILLVTVAIFVYEVNGRIAIHFVARIVSSSKTIVVGALNTVTDALCNITLTLPPLFLREDTKENLLEELENLDNILCKYYKGNRGTTGINIQLIILHLVYFSLLMNDLYPWLVLHDLHHYQYYVFDHFYRYRLSVLVIYASSLINGLQRRIYCINTALSEELERIFNQNLDSETIRRLEGVIQDMSEAHAKFINLIRYFNRMFGWQMLAVFLNYIFLFLIAFDGGLRIIKRCGSINQQLLLWAAVSLVYAMVGAALVTSICDKTTNEARKTADLAFYYYYNLNISKYNPGQACLAKSLTLLIRQTRSSLTTFSAAGFFPIDYSTLFLLMNLLTSYLIVLIQFE